MPKGIIIESSADSAVLKKIEYEISNPKEYEVQIQHIAIEVNFIDIYHRKGIYNLDYNPKIPGVSAVGEIIKVGSKVAGFQKGNKVGYVTAKGGAYCEIRNISSELVFAIPDSMNLKVLGSCLVKALTAHYLACRVFIVRNGTAVLVHAAAGGVGKILSQWCKLSGAYVIGTVGSNEKKAIAKKNGCDYVLNYTSEDWVSKVKEITNNIGVNAVYDSIGQETYLKSIECLMNMGMMVLYGGSSGMVNSVDINVLASKSLFFTKPSLFHYKAHRMELIISCNELFERINVGGLVLEDPQEIKLADAQQAHELLESRTIHSPIILVP